MTKRIWNNFFKNKKPIKNFGHIFFDYSKPCKDVIELAAFFRQNKVKTVLDLGCGEGRNSRFLSEKKFGVIGVDLSVVAIKKAQLQDNKTKYFVADMKQIPFPDNFFDWIISLQTIFHGRLCDIRKTIAEISRVTKKYGLIFITLQPIKGNEYRMGKKLETNTYISTAGDDNGEIHHFFDKAEILKEFCDFEIINLHLDKENNYWYLLMIKKT